MIFPEDVLCSMKKIVVINVDTLLHNLKIIHLHDHMTMVTLEWYCTGLGKIVSRIFCCYGSVDSVLLYKES